MYQFWCFEQCYVDDIDVVFLVRRVNKRHQSHLWWFTPNHSSISFPSLTSYLFRNSAVDNNALSRDPQIVEKKQIKAAIASDWLYWLNLIGFLAAEWVWLRTRDTSFMGVFRLLRFPFSYRWIMLYDRLVDTPKSLARIAALEFLGVSLQLFYALHLFGCVWFYTLGKTTGYGEYVAHLHLLEGEAAPPRRYYLLALRDAIALFVGSPTTTQSENMTSL